MARYSLDDLKSALREAGVDVPHLERRDVLEVLYWMDNYMTHRDALRAHERAREIARGSDAPEVSGALRASEGLSRDTPT